MRPFSGTWGSLPPTVAVVALVAVGSSGWIISVSLVLFLLLGAIACVRFGTSGERAFGAKDPSSIVADEVAGVALTLAVVPWWMLTPAGEMSIPTAVVIAGTGFVSFRIFDVWKPGFVSGLQDRPAGWGILLDDLGAAVCAWPCTLVAAAWVA